MGGGGREGERAAWRVRVHGRVQGVAFRWHTRERARSLGLCGVVRNQDDGSVEVRVEGEPAAVEALIDWLALGPQLARVDRLERVPDEPQGFEGFRIQG